MCIYIYICIIHLDKVAGVRALCDCGLHLRYTVLYCTVLYYNHDYNNTYTRLY